MSRETDRIAQIWGAPTSAQPVPQERYEQYRDLVPEVLFTIWREFGFAGFADGLWWICDPVAWQPAVDTWTAGLQLDMGDDQWIALVRNAFGEMHLWGRRTGRSLVVVPYLGRIYPTDHSAQMATEQDRYVQMYGEFLALRRDTLDAIGDDGQPLFDRVLAGVGPVGPDTVYGFVPAPALGGSMRADRVEIVDAEVHLQLLSEITPRQIMGDAAQTPIWRPVRIDQNGLAGQTARLLTDDPTDDAGWPADLPPGTSEVTLLDDTPGPNLTLRVQLPNDPSTVAHIRFDQLAVR